MYSTDKACSRTLTYCHNTFIAYIRLQKKNTVKILVHERRELQKRASTSAMYDAFNEKGSHVLLKDTHAFQYGKK